MFIVEAEEIKIDGDEVSLDEDLNEEVKDDSSPEIELHETPEEALEHEPEAIVIVDDSGPTEEGHVVVNSEPEGLVIEVGDIEFESPIPGVDSDIAEEILSVSDQPEQDIPDENNADLKKTKKKSPKWDWRPVFEKDGANGFMSWVKERFSDVPRHSGKDSAGIERAISYLNKLNSEISACMKYDEDGDLNADHIEAARAKIEKGIDSLEKALKAISKSKKDKKKTANLDDDSIVKEAQRIVGLQGNYINVPLLISSLARMCINGSISAGHSMEDNIHMVSDKFKLDEREKFSLAFLIQDMGFPVKADRFFSDVMEKRDISEDGLDFAANYLS